MTDDLSRTIEAQAHRLYSIDVEHTIGDMTVKTSYFFHDVPPTPTAPPAPPAPAPDTEIEVNIRADLDTSFVDTLHSSIKKAVQDSETKAMRRYQHTRPLGPQRYVSTKELSDAIDRINVKIDSLEQQIFNLKTMMLKA